MADAIKDLAARLDAQNAEFDAARELAKQMRRIELTPVVDDDYPSVRFDYERAVRAFLDACRANRSDAPSETKRDALDAARYRWLRSEHACTDPLFYPFWHEFEAKLCREEKMDKLIDDAMTWKEPNTDGIF